MALKRAHQFIIREYTAQIQSYKVQFNDIDNVSEKDEPRESHQAENLDLKFDILSTNNPATPLKEAIELSHSPVRHRANNIFMNSKSKGCLSQNSDGDLSNNFISQKSRRRIVTKQTIQADVDEIDVDNVFTSPNTQVDSKPFDISEYFGEKIDKI